MREFVNFLLKNPLAMFLIFSSGMFASRSMMHAYKSLRDAKPMATWREQDLQDKLAAQETPFADTFEPQFLQRRIHKFTSERKDL